MKELHPAAGVSLYIAIEDAKIMAKYYGSVYLIFNDVRLQVSEDSLDLDISEIYRLKLKCGEYGK